MADRRIIAPVARLSPTPGQFSRSRRNFDSDSSIPTPRRGNLIGESWGAQVVDDRDRFLCFFAKYLRNIFVVKLRISVGGEKIGERFHVELFFLKQFCEQFVKIQIE